MLVTRDYLRADPWDALIARVNDAYCTELQPYSTKLESLTALTGTATKVVIIPDQGNSPNSTSPPIERVEYTYDRLDLRSFFKGAVIKNVGGFALPTNTFNVVDSIGEFNDIVFTLDDFEQAEYDEYNRAYTLTANPESLRFVGTINFQLVNTTKRLIQNVATKFELPLANTWGLGNLSNGAKMTAQYLTSGYDFTMEREFLKDLTTTSTWPGARKLAAIIGNVTGDPWVCKPTASDWNIGYDIYNGAARIQLLYNGRVLPRYSPRSDILNVVVIKLSDLSTNVAGYLLLHYN